MVEEPRHNQDTDYQALREELNLGEQAYEWFESNLGKYVMGVAKQEVDLALLELQTVAPWRVFKINRLQNRIKIATAAVSWLQDTIVAGQAAYEQLDELEGEGY